MIYGKIKLSLYLIYRVAKEREVRPYVPVKGTQTTTIKSSVLNVCSLNSYVAGVPYISANIYSKARNLPITDTHNYRTDLRLFLRHQVAGWYCKMTTKRLTGTPICFFRWSKGTAILKTKICNLRNPEKWFQI